MNIGNVKDITGQKFGKWTVIECAGRDKRGGAIWKCICECGNERIVDGGSLRSGTSKSCGCDSVRLRKKFFETTPYPNSTHNGRNERLYGIWHGIKDRCFNKNAPAYMWYGGRGITVCDEWKDDYSCFRKWALESGYDCNAPKGQCTLDRINNDDGYSPSNCRWVSSKTQNNNRRNNHTIEFNGEIHTITEWSEKIGIRKDTLRRRIVKYGWSVERALTEKNNHLK